MRAFMRAGLLLTLSACAPDAPPNDEPRSYEAILPLLNRNQKNVTVPFWRRGIIAV